MNIDGSVPPFDCVVIGGGAAGLAGALEAHRLGLQTLLIENNDRLGGIPFQCIHPGFGLFHYKEDLTGTEFAERFIKSFHEQNISCIPGGHVCSIHQESSHQKHIKVVTQQGIHSIQTKTILYATGARERHLFETGITGDRVSGIFTAGEAQTMMDVDGIMPGNRILIIGSGDIGLIMARRFALEGATVVGVVEMMPYATGLTRNIVQCLHDFNIPLFTSTKVQEIHGTHHVEQVRTVAVDASGVPIKGTEKIISCDMVALATGLIPYTEKLQELGVQIDPCTRGPMVTEEFQSSLPGIFVAGNALTINDYVDDAAAQGINAAQNIHQYIDTTAQKTKQWITITKQRNIRLVVPQMISAQDDVYLYIRVEQPETGVNLCIPELGLSVKKKKVTPSEMIKLSLTKKQLEGITDTISLEITL